MTNFFISQLKITGSEVRPATLEFKQGANIIYGNSDEGKSYIVECLDFMFGAKNMRFEDQEKQLNEAIANSAMLHRQLEELRKRQISYQMQRENQHLLQELYDRQAQRLTFAMEGELLSHQSGNQKCHCPFCGAESESALDENALKATSTEVEQTGIAVRSLQDLDKELDRRMKRHQKKIDGLQAQIIALDKEIASAYAPAVAELRSKIAVYLESYSLRQTKDRLMLDYSTWQTKYERFSDPIADSARFKIKEEYPKEFFDAMKDILFAMLHECDLADLKTVDFRAGTMDISVNRQEKNTFGEGYRGILNMAVAFSLFTHLCNKGIYSPGLLIMDSPIQAMNEPAESKLTRNLISYICRNAGCGQVFIIDNEIPADADYADAKVHQIGSEGLLPDFKRPVRKMTQSEAAEQSKHIDGIVTTIPVELK